MLVGQVLLQRVEMVGEVAAVAFEPLVDLAERLWAASEELLGTRSAVLSRV